MINTKAHALVDYLMGLTLLFSPWVFGFSSGGAAYLIMLAAGSLIILQAAFTKFEYALIKWIPLRAHLAIDFLAGIVLAASPWFMRFSENVFKPHLVFGLALVVVALLTDRMLYKGVKVIQVHAELHDLQEQHTVKQHRENGHAGKT